MTAVTTTALGISELRFIVMAHPDDVSSTSSHRVGGAEVIGGKGSGTGLHCHFYIGLDTAANGDMVDSPLRGQEGMRFWENLTDIWFARGVTSAFRK